MPRLAAVLAALALAPPPGLAGRSCEPAAPVTEIAPGVYVRGGRPVVVFEGAGVANLGFVVGERCVAVIDTGGDLDEGRALGCAVHRVTTLPVCYVVNTHGHPDHVLGNLAFKAPGTSFVGHHKLPRALALLGPTYLARASEAAGTKVGPEHLVYPDVLVEGRLDLDLGARRLRITAHETAHTDQDLSVHDPLTGTLWLADLLFVDHVPVIAGSLNGWLAELDGLGALDAERAVPGHGPVAVPWPGARTDLVRYLSVLREEIRALVAKGATLEAAVETAGQSERERWMLFDRYHRRNVTSAFAELEWE